MVVEESLRAVNSFGEANSFRLDCIIACDE